MDTRDSGKNIDSRDRDGGRSRGGGGNYQNQQQGPGRGGGRGRVRAGSHSGLPQHQQRRTWPPFQGNFGAVRGFQLSVQGKSYGFQLSVQGQSYGPKQEEAGPSSGRGGIGNLRPWGPTRLPLSVPSQRAQSTDDLEISEQPASPPESEEKRSIVTHAVQSILISSLSNLLTEFISWLLSLAGIRK
ncbi:protein argonaute 18-like [Olea europaea var. sylvestris]|uniref:protein argonaute 18-like n=1 Tax=Olea europaea var. sylvestris TaxID=158386 RepID=UPI000C1CEB8B|nr:protein argonaute 18-like [Olea europaea var. sylvestris]